MKNIILLGFALLLGGCVSGLESLQTEMAEKDIATLEASEAQSLYSGSTSYLKHRTYEFLGYRAEDGSMKGIAWGSWGEERDTGTWMVNDDGQLCSEWDGVWANGIRCFVTYPSDEENQFVQAIVSGNKSDSTPSGIYKVTITPGDSSGI